MSLMYEVFDAFLDPQSRHAMLVHAPIVLALLTPVVAALSAIQRAENRTLRWLSVATFAAFLLAAVAAAKSGESALAEIGDASHAARRVAQRHAQMANAVWAFAAGGLLLACGAWLRRRKLARGAAALSVLVGGISAAWVGLTAHYGGTLVYGFGVGTPALHAWTDADGASGTTTTQPTADPRVAYFATEVRPLLTEKCAGCHGPGEFANGGLSLASANSVLTGGSRGPAVVPGHPSESLLIRALAGDGLPRMPYGRDPLTARQIEILRRWIRDGAVWDK